MKIAIPYAKTHLEFEIPAGTDAEILRSKQVPVPDGVTQDQLVLDALAELERRHGRYALCTMCIGVGQGIALIIERA